MNQNQYNPAFRLAVSYIDKSRDFYAAQGYKIPYRWAINDQVPFQKLTKPLSESNVGLVTTASLPDPEISLNFDPGILQIGSTYKFSSSPTPKALYTMDRSWHKKATHTNDLGSFFPLDHLKLLAEQKIIKSVSNHFYGAPTDFSQRKTNETIATEILSYMKKDNVDVAILVPLWPVCHQTVSLVARFLESNNIPTVIIGSAKDIVEQCGVPRFIFSDFPLGNPVGIPYNTNMQIEITKMALTLLEKAKYPRTSIQTPFTWHNHEWRETYMEVNESNRELLARAGEIRRARQTKRKYTN